MSSALAAAAAATTLGVGCAASSPTPPELDPYFPAAVALSADQRFLFVANANADLAWGSGTVQVYDLEQVAAMMVGWQGGQGSAPAGCAVDRLRPELARCPSDDPAQTYVADSVRIGNFVAGMAAQELADGRTRLFTTVRGDPSLTWIDFDPASRRLDCNDDPAGSFEACDEPHRLDNLLNDPQLGVLSAEPFGVAVDSASSHVLVTHLSTGRVTLAHAPVDGSPPVLVDAISGLWAPNQANLVSAVSVAPRLPGDPNGFFYVTSRSEARVNLVRAVDVVGTDGTVLPRLVRGPFFFYTAEPGLPGLSYDARGLAFTADGNRAVIVGRVPPSLVIVDTTMGDGGEPTNQVLAQVEVCGQPVSVALDERDPGERLAYVACFANGEVWAVDIDRARLVTTIMAGRGPTGVAVAAARNLALVVNYGDDTVNVIDLDPSSPSYQHSVLELGKRRVQTEEE